MSFSWVYKSFGDLSESFFLSTPTPETRQTNQPCIDFLSDRYENISQIGVGGMGVVLKAKDKVLDKWVAIKILPSENASNEQVIRFHQEAKASSKLNHPNLISVLDFGVNDRGQLYLVMDFIEGLSLEQKLKKEHFLPEAAAISIILQICKGLAQAHSKNVIHRDIKPSNILLTDDENIKLVDFGIAKSETVSELTKTGIAMGSPGYMSPEQVAGGVIDSKTDQYSLGCLLFRLLTGKVPFKEETALETMQKHMIATPPTLKEVSGLDFNPKTEKIVAKLLSKKPSDRYQSVNDLSEALSSINSDDSRPETAGEDIKGNSKRNYRVLFLSGVGLLAFLFLVYGLVQKAGEDSKPKGSIARKDKKNSKSLKAKRDKKNTEMGSYISQHNSFVTIAETVEAKQLSQLQSEKITKLFLNKCRISDPAVFKMIGKLNSLKELNMSKCKGLKDRAIPLIVSEDPGQLQLQELKLSDSDIDVKTFHYLSKLPSLRYLLVNGLNITDENLDDIVKLKLFTLDLSGTFITDSGVAKLKKMKTLLFVSLQYNKITKKSLKVLAEMKNLRVVSLNGIFGVKPEDIKWLQEKRPDLEIRYKPYNIPKNTNALLELMGD